jgi:hypothetical protein
MREIDVCRRHDFARSTRSALKAPVKIGVSNYLRGRWRTPLGEIFGGVRVGDQSRSVSAGEPTMRGGAHARVGLRADNREAADADSIEHLFQTSGLERVAILLADDDLTLCRREGGNDLPDLAADRQLSEECCTQTTGTASARARSTKVTMLATTGSRLWAAARTPF